MATLRRKASAYKQRRRVYSLKKAHLDFMIRKLESAQKQWGRLAQEREQDLARLPEDADAQRLKRFALVGVLGMAGCWIAQWVWWVGFIGTMGDSYCPPKLKEMGVIWTVFSALGAFFGGAGV